MNTKMVRFEFICVTVIVLLAAAVLLAGCRRRQVANVNNVNTTSNPVDSDRPPATPEQTPQGSPQPSVTPTPKPAGPSATAFRLDDRAWVKFFRGGEDDLDQSRPKIGLRNKDRINTNERGKALLSIFGCASATLYHNSNLTNSRCPASSSRSGSLSACVTGALNFNKDPVTCARRITFETGSAVVNLEGTNVDLYYYPLRQATVVMLYSGRASIFPVLDPGDRRHRRTIVPEPIILSKPDECMVTQTGETALLPDIAGVPQRKVRPCEEFPPVLKELGQTENAKKATADQKARGNPPPPPFEKPVIGFPRLIQNQLDFEGQAMGTQSIRDLEIENRGLPALTISQLKIEGSSDFEVIQDLDCLNKPIERWCKAQIGFRPTAIERRQAQLLISHNTDGSPSTISLIGTGTAPPPPPIELKLDARAESTFFPIQKVGTTTTRQVVLRNTGQAPLRVDEILIEGAGQTAFVTKDQCRKTMATNETCTIEVTFAPQTPEGFTAKLTIIADEADPAASTVRTFTVPPVELKGTGAVPIISTNQTDLCFGKHKVVKESDPLDRQTLTLTVSNSGLVPLTVSNVLVNNDDFRIVEDTCKAGDVAANAGACRITVGFTPRKSHLREGVLTIMHDDKKANPTNISLKGAGKARNPVRRFFQWIFNRPEDPCK